MPNLHSNAVALFQGVLNGHPEVARIDLQRLRMTDAIVTEAQDGDAPLSDAILDACFPNADTSQEFAHYTRFSTLESIAQTGEWRLYWVLKRITEHEFSTFSDDHGLDGYLAIDPATGNQVYEDLCKDLFYTSVTQFPSANEADMWQTFGEDGNGVRLVFRIQPTLRRAAFRSVRYKNPLSQTIIQELSETTRDQLQRRLVLMGISRIGAFYLPLGYNDEQESRILIKRFHVPDIANDPWAIVKSDGTHQYLPLPLNQPNDFCRIELVRVDAGPNRSQQSVDKILRQNPMFAHLASSTFPAVGSGSSGLSPDRGKMRQQVSELAFRLWEKRGVWGDPLTDWLAAKQQLGIDDESI